MKKTYVRLLKLASLLVGTATAPLTAQSAWRVADTIPVPNDGGWDYLTVDSEARRLYVSHSTRVAVIDIQKDSVIGEIPNTNGVHGIAIARDLGRGFTSNGRDSTVTMFSLNTLVPLQTIKVTGRNPDAILYEPKTKRVFTFNGASANATAIDATTGRVVGTIALSGKPETAVHDGTGKVFVAIEDQSSIAVFDAGTLQALSEFPLTACREPTGVAIDRTRRLLFVGCSNRLMSVVEAASGRTLVSAQVGAGVDGVAYDATLQRIFTSNGVDGTMSIIRLLDNEHVAVDPPLPTKRGARTIALDERTHRLYTATADFVTPEATTEQPHPRPTMVSGSFKVLMIAPVTPAPSPSPSLSPQD